MKRRLDETRVGEYRSNFILNIIFVVVTLLAIVALFIAPIYYLGDYSCSQLVKFSPINYLIDNGLNSVYGYFSLSLVILFGFIFINSYLCFSIPKLGKSVYIKIIKIVEALMSLSCLVLLSFCLYGYDFEYIKGYMLICFAWQILLTLVMIMAIFSYFKIKKISIYD